MKTELWDLHVLKENKTPIIFSKYCMVQSLGKKKSGCLPCRKKREDIKKILHHNKVSNTAWTLYSSFLSQNGGNYFVIKTLSLLSSALRRRISLMSFLSIRGFHFMISLHFSIAKCFWKHVTSIIKCFKNIINKFLIYG